MAKAKETVTLYFDGEPHECAIREDGKGNYVCKADNGRFARFSKENFENEVEHFNAYGARVVEIIPDVVYGKVITFDKDGNEIV